MIKTVIFDIGGVLFKPSIDPLRKFAPIEEGINLLAECAHHQIYVCTNFAAPVVEFLINEYPEYFDQVKAYITPTIALTRKPHPEMFQYLIDKYPIIPHESVFIDDSIHNVVAARQAGFIGIHATDMSLVREELQALGVL